MRVRSPRRLVAASAELLGARPRLGSELRAATSAALIASVFAIGVVDAGTGADLTLGVFYLLPVAVATIIVGSGAGVAVAVQSAVVWVAADALRAGPSARTIVQVANGAFRALILVVVVALLAGLRHALDQAKASEQRSRNFLAFAAHQLRTPVAGVRTAADALLVQRATAGQEPLLRHIADEAGRCGRLVSSLLRVARLDQGEAFVPRACDVASMLEAVVERLRMRAPHLAVGLELDPSLRAPAWLSPEATTEALTNLVDNAPPSRGDIRDGAHGDRRWRAPSAGRRRRPRVAAGS